MNVTNKTSITLGLPRTGPLQPNESTDIEEAVAQNRIVCAWIAKGMLQVNGKGSSKPAEKQTESTPTEDQEKDALIAALADLGIKRDKRTSVENLRATLEDAEAEASKDDSGDSDGGDDDEL